MVRIGVLSVHSKSTPAMARHYMNGLRLALDQHNTEYQLLVEGVGEGTNAQPITEKGQKLTLQENVDVIIGLLGHRGKNELREFAEAMETPIIISNLGANVPWTETLNEWSFTLSADFWHGSYLYSKKAADLGYSQTGVITSYYDSGYGFVHAVESGFIEDKTTFAGHYIAPLNLRDNEQEYLDYFLENVSVDAHYLLGNGVFAKEILELLEASDKKRDKPLWAAIPTIQPEILKTHGKTLHGVKSIGTWFEQLDTTTNQDFVSAYRDEFDKSPDFFALLGYETGLVLAQCVADIGEAKPNSNRIKKALAKVQVDGPRGNIAFDQELYRYMSNQYVLEVVNVDGETKVQQGEYLGHDREKYLEFIHAEDDFERGGWMNPYLSY